MYSLYIADDEKSVVTGLQKNVRWDAMGIRVCGTAFNGADAYAEIEAQNPDFALLDIRMPCMSGLEIIERLQGRVDTLFLVFSGYDEFNYVKKAMDLDVVEYLLKPSAIPDIEKAFIKAIERRNNMWLLDKYYSASHGTFPEKNVPAPLRPLQLFPALERFYAFVCIRMQFARPDFLSAYLELRKELNRMHTDSCHLFHYQVAGGIALIAAVTQTDAPDRLLQEVVEQLCAAISGKPEPIHYGIGSTVYDPTEIEASMAKAETALDTCMFAGMEHQEISTLPAQAQEPVMVRVAAFSARFVVAQDVFDISGEVDAFLEFLVSNQLPSDQIKWICVDMLYSIHRAILSEHNIQISSIVEQNNIGKHLLTVLKMDELKQLLCQVLESTREYISISQQGRKSSVIHRIKQYIRANLDKRFTLEAIADEFYLNPAYVSCIFKKETGINLFTYIADLRIEKAKNLLKNTNMKIVDIALHVGYNDQRYFCQIFKQKCGVTATQYREQ